MAAFRITRTPILAWHVHTAAHVAAQVQCGARARPAHANSCRCAQPVTVALTYLGSFYFPPVSLASRLLK